MLVSQAREAIEHTASGHHVNLVTHGEHGHPSAYLYDELDPLDTVRYECIKSCSNPYQT